MLLGFKTELKVAWRIIKNWATNSLPATSKEHQFYSLLLSLTAAVSKESSNNIAIVALAAMFFGFTIVVLKPATPTANPPLINQQSNPIIFYGIKRTNFTTKQQ